jgi:peptidoglycan/xylan/chitin deacetylase (PgdA/CDA1 family)
MKTTNSLQPFALQTEQSVAAKDDFPSSNGWSARCKQAARWSALQAASGLRSICGGKPGNGFGILMYHRVTEPIPGTPQPTWNVTPAKLHRQLRGLTKRGFTPLPLQEVLAIHEAGLPVPPRTFVVTFDDGYANNYLQAAPVLEYLGVPATVFLATSFLDQTTPFPFDDWSAAGSPDVPVDSWRPMTTDECKAMSASGLIELGAHTHTHTDFRNRTDDLFADLTLCRNILHDKFGIDKPTFAFPYGTKHLGFSGPIFADIAKRAGMRCSLTTESELVTDSSSPFDWGRFTADGHDSAATLAVKLDGWYESIRGVWRKFRKPFGSEQSHSSVLNESPLTIKETSTTP